MSAPEVPVWGWLLLSLGVPTVLLLLWGWACSPVYFQYAGKVVAVFGGSSGIGKSISLEALKRGARVVLIARKIAVLDEAKAWLQAELKLSADEASNRIQVVSCDSTDEKACIEAASTVKQSMGGVDMLVYSAGISEPAKLVDLPASTFRRVLDVNVFGARNAVVSFLPLLQASGHGSAQGARVVLVGSTLSVFGLYGLAAYSASKVGIFGFAQALHQELLPDNIRTCLTLPADTDTPLLARENETKPQLTKDISGAASTQSPEEVAQGTMEGAARGQFLITTEFTTWLMTLTSAGMAPAPTLGEKIPQVLLASLVRCVALWFQWSWDGILLAEREAARKTFLEGGLRAPLMGAGHDGAGAGAGKQASSRGAEETEEVDDGIAGVNASKKAE